MPIAPSGATFRPHLAQYVVEHQRLREAYAAPRILPYLDVDTEAGIFYRVPATTTSRLPNVAYNAKSGFNRDDFEMEEDTFATKSYGFEGVLTDKDRARYGDAAAGESGVAAMTADIVMANQEKRCADAIFNETTFPASGTTGVTVSNAWSSSSGTPITDVNVGRRVKQSLVGPEPNALIIHYKTLCDLATNAQIIDRLKAISSIVENGMLSVQQLQQVFAIPNVIVVGMNAYNTADKGVTASLSGLWATGYAMLCYIADGDPRMSPQIGRTLAWSQYGSRMSVTQYRDDKVQGDVFQVWQNVQEKVFGSRFGYLMKSV